MANGTAPVNIIGKLPASRSHPPYIPLSKKTFQERKEKGTGEIPRLDYHEHYLVMEVSDWLIFRTKGKDGEKHCKMLPVLCGVDAGHYVHIVLQRFE